MRWIIRLAALAIAALCVGLWITRPQVDGADVLAGLTPDLDNGETLFITSGCANCHAAPAAKGEDTLVLAGGRPIASPFGTFIAPNISPDPVAGIGAWSTLDLWNALHNGTGKAGEHLYPALPYASYIRMTPQQVVDLDAYLRSLPADPTPSAPHQIGFPFNQRLLLGGWKFLYLREGWVMQADDLTPFEARGRRIVEAEAHCAECHSPRDMFGGPIKGARWLTGGADPHGGRYPDLTPDALGWSEDDIVQYLTTGFTPDYDMAGGHMALVVENFAKLPIDDREAVAAYLMRLPLSD